MVGNGPPRSQTFLVGISDIFGSDSNGSDRRSSAYASPHPKLIAEDCAWRIDVPIDAIANLDYHRFSARVGRIVLYLWPT
ncbi:hypothetical protein REMIM1_PE00156 (plasmid) [Rhizobium etli bv. mimosae str. Mim1]|nr:hypothetical protein REMIM1_PE00156 [Rhizobium etli bv. mimosae str. Mim1]